MGKIMRNRISVLAIVFVLMIGTVIPGITLLGEGSSMEKTNSVESGETIVLVNIDGTEQIDDLKGYGNIIDHYGKNVLIRTTKKVQEELAKEYDIDRLEHRNELNVKGHQFNTKEDTPTLKSENNIEEYQPGTEGIYIVDMIGPINPEWRNSLETKGAEVINYVPNYAYEVTMTPEEAQQVEEFDFVDWVGIYQPNYKLDPQIDKALEKDKPINVRLNPSSEMSGIESSIWEHDIVGYEDLQDKGERLVIDIDSEDQINELAERQDVYYISSYEKPELHSEMAIQQIGGGQWFMDDEYEHTGGDQREGDPDKPYRKHGDYGAYMNQLGYTGKGVTVAVADTGIGDGTVGNAGVEDFTGRVIGGYGLGEDEDYWAGGHYHGTACAGLIAGDTYDGSGSTWNETDDGENPYYMGQGLASDSDMFAMKIFDDDGAPLINEYYPIIEEVAQRSDAYIHSNSWGSGTKGSYVESDEVYDKAVRDADRDTVGNQPMVITTSAGNDGWMGDGTIGSPATAKNVITVGGNQPYNPGLGYENPENMYDSSSRGWTKDNRIKPDVVAPSESVISQNTPLDDEGEYIAASGTSFGNPLVAGASSVVVDWYEQNYGERPSPAMVKSILINTANELDPDKGDTRGHIPNQDEGWGVVDISKLEYPTEDPLNFMFKDQNSLLTTGEEDEYQVTYDNENKPMKITLTWTDKNALAGDNEDGSLALKNNLDLEVETPSGEVIRGNAFDLSGDGMSDDGFTHADAEVMDDFDPDGDGYDDVNNVENVYIPSENLESGIYTIKVAGTNIPSDANNDGQANQDYALTSQNSIFPEDGEFSMDSDRYREDDTVEFTVIDQDMFDQDTVDIQVNSTDEQGNLVDQMNVTLRGERRGVVTGSVDISPGFNGSDEGLYVEDGFEIKASYYDQAMEEYKYESAKVDGKPPESVSDIEVTWSNENEGHNNITWQISGDDSLDQFEGYKVYRAESVNGAPDGWEHIDTLDNGTEKYIDDDMGKNDHTRYWYEIGAVDEVGNENLSGNSDIEPPSVRVDSPGEDEIWTTGEEEEIEWYAGSGGLATTISIDYSNDTGENWTNIVDGHDVDHGEGNYTWTIPQIEGVKNKSLIQITIEDAKGNSTSKSETFVLTEYASPSLEINSPVETDRWYANTTEDIQWNTILGDGGEITSVVLEYSLDGGDTWSMITEENQDNETYSWEIPQETSSEGVIRISIEDNNDLYAENVSDQFDIIASEVPENAAVDYVSLEEEVLFQDSLQDGTAKAGYNTDEVPNGVNPWDVRDHGASSGEHSWDFGDAGYENVEGGSLSWLISPEITVPADINKAELTFHQWRDFDYRYDAGNMKISTDGNNWELIEPTAGYSDSVSEEFDNPLAGEPAWTGMSRWEEVKFDLSDYAGETVRFNWSAGIDSWEADEDGWRIDNIEVTAERPFVNEGDNMDNRLTWSASPDDGSGENNVKSYNIYRSTSMDELGGYVDNVTADGSANYRYFDRDAGTADNKTWRYTVKTETDDSIEGHQGDSAMESKAPYPHKEPEPVDNSAVSVGQHETIELSFTAAHALSDTSMNVSFFEAETDELIGEVNEVYPGEVASVEWDEFLTEGEHSWYVTVDDGTYVVKNEEWSFLVDNSDPEVEITAPQNKEMLNKSDIVLSIDGSDDISGIDHYEARVRQALSWTDIGKRSEVTVQNVPEGERVIDVRANDRAGNQYIDTVEFTVDTTDPVVDIKSPQTGDAVAENRVTLEWSGDDDTTEIENYEVQLNNGTWSDAGLGDSFTVSGLKKGDNVIRVRATDSANNHKTSQIEITYDPTSPDVNVTSIEEGEEITKDQAEVAWEGEVTWKDIDAISPVEKYEVRLNNQGWKEYDYEEPDPPAKAGDMMWKHEKHDDYVYSVYESDGVVYSGSWDETVLAYDYENEEVLWQHDHHDGKIGYVVENDGVVFSASYDGTVVAADAEDGSLIWQHEHHSGNVYAVDAANGVVYSGGMDSTVIAADSETGEKIWQHEHHSDGFGVFSVHASDGVVYSGSIIDNLVVAADADTGEKIWQHEHHGGMVYSVYESNGVVYSGSDGGWGNPGQVIAADAETGEMIWKHEHHNSMVYSVQVENGVVYSGSDDGRVIAADADTGDKLWEHSYHNDFVYSVFESDGVIYSASGDGSVIACHAVDEEPAPTPELSHTYRDLEDGEYTAQIRATNAAGNQYTETIIFTVNTPEPELEITSPTDAVEGMTYEEEFTIEGNVGNAEAVHINGEEVVLENDEFNHSFSLDDGYNEFTVVAEDDAGKRVEKTISAMYLPDIPELWNEIDTVQENITTIQDEISELQNNIAVIEENIAALEDDIAAMEEDIENNISAIQDNIETIENNIAEIETDFENNITMIEEDISAIESKIAANEDDIGELDNNLTQAQSEITSIEEDIQEVEGDISTVKDDIDELKDKKDSLATEQENQESDLGMSRNLGIVGIIIGILATVLAIFAIRRNGPTKEEKYGGETESHDDEKVTIEKAEELSDESADEPEEEP